jgi:dihydrofolate reductase
VAITARPTRPGFDFRSCRRDAANAGLIDEFTIALSPVLFGSGIRLFEGVNADRVALEPVRAEPTQRVTHLTYAVRER